MGIFLGLCSLDDTTRVDELKREIKREETWWNQFFIICLCETTLVWYKGNCIEWSWQIYSTICLKGKEDEHLIPIDELHVPQKHVFKIMEYVTRIHNILDDMISPMVNIALKQNFGIQLIAGTIESIHQPFCDVWESVLWAKAFCCSLSRYK